MVAQNIPKPQEDIKIIPKMTVFCPVHQEEMSGRGCFDCPNFKGLELEKDRKFVYVLCSGTQLISQA